MAESVLSGKLAFSVEAKGGLLLKITLKCARERANGCDWKRSESYLKEKVFYDERKKKIKKCHEI